MEHEAALLNLIFLVFFLVFFIAPLIWLYARILRRAGYSGWWAPLMFVPWVNVVALWVFAFMKWPRHRPAGAAETRLRVT